jgi:hypothetical protein
VGDENVYASEERRFRSPKTMVVGDFLGKKMGEALTRILDVVSTPNEAQVFTSIRPKWSKERYVFEMTECVRMRCAVLVGLVPRVCLNKRERH